MPRRPLIPAPSNDVLSTDFATETLPSPIDPVGRTNIKIVEPVPYNPNYRMIPQSVFNTMASMFDIVQTLWWPSPIPWERSRFSDERTELDQQYATQPRGNMSPLSDRRNIRQPAPLSQGGLQFLSEGEAP